MLSEEIGIETPRNADLVKVCPPRSTVCQGRPGPQGSAWTVRSTEFLNQTAYGLLIWDGVMLHTYLLFESYKETLEMLKKYHDYHTPANHLSKSHQASRSSKSLKQHIRQHEASPPHSRPCTFDFDMGDRLR